MPTSLTETRRKRQTTPGESIGIQLNVGDIVVLLLEKYSGSILVAAILVYLVLEFGLDVAHEFVVDWIRKKIKEAKDGSKEERKESQ